MNLKEKEILEEVRAKLGSFSILRKITKPNVRIIFLKSDGKKYVLKAYYDEERLLKERKKLELLKSDLKDIDDGEVPKIYFYGKKIFFNGLYRRRDF